MTETFDKVTEGDLIEDVLDGIPHQVMIKLSTGLHLLQISSGSMSHIFISRTYINSYFRVLKSLPDNGATTPEYWDCKCALGYINPKTVTHCDHCGADYESNPQDFSDSRMREVVAAGLHLMPSLRRKVLKQLQGRHPWENEEEEVA